MSKKIKILFTASLILNTLLIGLVGGGIYKRWSSLPWQDIKQEISPETRHVVGRTFRKSFKEMRPKMKDMKRYQGSMAEVLAADDFDAAKYDKLAERMKNVHLDLISKRIDVTKELALQLPAEDRAKLASHMADILAKPGRKSKNRLKPRKGPPPPPPETPESKKIESKKPGSDNGSEATAE